MDYDFNRVGTLHCNVLCVKFTRFNYLVECSPESSWTMFLQNYKHLTVFIYMYIISVVNNLENRNLSIQPKKQYIKIKIPIG